MSHNNPVLGLILIIVGCILLFAILLPVAVHLLVLLLALYLINCGLVMREKPNLSYFLRIWWAKIKNFVIKILD